MKFVLAPHIPVSLGEPLPLTWSALERYGSVEISDDVDDTIGEVVKELITDHAGDVVGAEPSVDAPPFTPDYWWLATVLRDGDQITMVSLPPQEAYGIDADGLVRFAYPRELPVAAVVRAIDEGHYSTTEHTLVVTRAGEFGGNGHAISSLVIWLLQEFPMILLGVGVDRALISRDQRKRAQLEDLATAWAARHILYPMSLRLFVESKRAWYSAVHARRLGISEAAAQRLLEALGYRASPHDHGLMEFSSMPDAQAARQLWTDAQWQPTFTSIDELLDSDSERPEPSSDIEYASPPAWRPFSERARRWLGSIVNRRRD